MHQRLPVLGGQPLAWTRIGGKAQNFLHQIDKLALAMFQIKNKTKLNVAIGFGSTIHGFS
jgi:hypothetical protein